MIKLHCKVEIHIDRDDGISLGELTGIGGWSFTDHMGESRIQWDLQSRSEIVESLKRILAVLE